MIAEVAAIGIIVYLAYPLPKFPVSGVDSDLFPVALFLNHLLVLSMDGVNSSDTSFFLHLHCL